MNAGETTKWPWQLTNTDVITRDPHHPDITGAWPVIGTPAFTDGCTIVCCDTGDGGEGVITYKAHEQATVRAQATYSAPQLLTDHERCEALGATSERERFFLLAQIIQRYGELFDAAYTQLQRARVAGAACLREEATP